MGRSRQTSTTTQSVPSWYQNFVTGDVFPAAREFAAQEFTPYEGEFVAGVSPLSMGAQPYFEQVGDISGMTPEDYRALNEQNLSGYTANVLDPALARMAREREIARTGEMADITRSGAFGNDRRAIFEAERAAQYELGRDQMIADLMRQGYNEAQAATMAQLQMGQGAAGQAAAGMMQLGNLEQLTRQGELDALYGEFMREQNLPLQQLGALSGAVGGVSVPVSTTLTQSGGGPGFAGILGGVASLGQGAAALGWQPFSDIRLKTNVRKVGQRGGVNFYNWEWNEIGKRMGAEIYPTEGVIAQELAEVHPDLVHMDAHGYLRVDYGGLEDRLG